MKHRFHRLASLGLGGLLAAAIAISPPLLGPRHPSEHAGAAMAVTSQSLEDRRRYMEETAPWVQQWRQRVKAFAARPARTAQALNTRQRILSEWSLVESTWHVLTVSFGTAWEAAQISYQQATDSFERTWREKVRQGL